jgi:hypothetical protein
VIDLRCQDVTAMLAGLPDGSAACVFADPPWVYSDGGPPMGKRRDRPNLRGIAKAYYHGLDEPTIAAHLAQAYRVAAPDAYLMVWCTFPKLLEWMRADAILPWRYITGAAWGKPGGTLGVGFHFRGDSELLLLYKKGQPRPLEGSKSNLWLAPRVGHSEKPQNALRALVRMGAPPDGLVVDCYAGASASLARACRALGRRYVGAELDPARHARALVRLSQQEMAWEGVA